MRIPGDHNTIASLDDLVKVLEPLLVLNLGDDEDVLALVPQDGLHLVHAGRVTDEGGKDHVHVLP